jgi:radical SAM protein with 4Fe4S-binding SPASM domain
LLDWGTFLSVLQELANAKYSGWIALHNFNEPLLNKRLDMEIRMIKSLLPDARSVVFTNGDMLDYDRCLLLQEAGTHSVRVTLYPEFDFSDRPNPDVIYSFLNKSNLNAKCNWHIDDSRQGISGYGKISGMEVEIIVPDIRRYVQRGGVDSCISNLRTSPCYMTSHSIAVDYQGRVKMCCNVVPEIPDNMQYLVGDIRKSSLLSIWDGNAMRNFRQLHQKSDWSQTPICVNCTQELPLSEVAKVTSMFDEHL